MQGSQLISYVRDKLDDDAYDAATILREGSWYVNQLSLKNRLRIFEESDTFNASAGATTADLPSDMQRFITIYSTSPQVANLSDYHMEYGEFMASHAGFATNTAAAASDWTDFGGAMRFAAPLNEAHTFAIDYLRTPKVVSSTSQKYELPRQYDEMLVKGTLVRIMEQDEDYEVSAQERQLLLELERDFVRNEARGQIKTGPVVISTSRKRRRNEW